MEIVFRLPGTAEYSYAEVRVDGASAFDTLRTVKDLDAGFWSGVGNALAQGCSLTALGALQPQVIEETGPAWNDAASAPQWAQNGAQEAQGYTSAPQQGYAPQNGSQPYQGAYASALQNSAQYNQQQPQSPPGQQAPMCQQHGRPAEFKPAGTSKKTGRPYNAFWACAAGDNNCTRASNFPRP